MLPRSDTRYNKAVREHAECSASQKASNDVMVSTDSEHDNNAHGRNSTTHARHLCRTLLPCIRQRKAHNASLAQLLPFGISVDRSSEASGNTLAHTLTRSYAPTALEACPWCIVLLSIHLYVIRDSHKRTHQICLLSPIRDCNSVHHPNREPDTVVSVAHVGGHVGAHARTHAPARTGTQASISRHAHRTQQAQGNIVIDITAH
jgi:hypothetical protein